MEGHIQQAPSVNSIVEAIASHANNTPGQLALRVGKEACTYSELWMQIRLAASRFDALPERSVILLSAEKSIPFIVHYFAVHLSNQICILADPKQTEQSIIERIREYNIRVCVSSKLTIEGVENYRYDIPSVQQSNPIYTFPTGESTADLMFTTGTTGASKCVPLSHSNLLASATNINSFIRNDDTDHELIALPLCHSFGLGRVRCALLAGGSCTVIPNFANERKLLALLSGGEITGFSMVPAAWQYIRHLCAERFIAAAQNLKFIEIGSAPLPVEDKQYLAQNLSNTRICMHYGLTEASRSAFMEFHADIDKLTSCGKASPGVKLAIYSAEGKLLGSNQPGEVCVQGKHVTLGYLNISRDECFYDNFFRTGDMGYLDNAGTLYIQGRIKEQINVGGKKVSPDEVEHKIAQLPGVKDCACIGSADPDGILGEVVKAYIVPHEGETIDIADIQKSLRDVLEPHKIPRIVELRNEALPRTDSGKLQRQKLQ